MRDLLCCLWGNRIGLRVETMFLHDVTVNRLKCAEPDMQRDFGRFDSTFPYASENVRSEMESCGGGSYRAPLARIYRLIALAIFCRIAASNVRRQRNMSKSFNDCKKILLSIVVVGGDLLKPDRPLSEFAPAHNLGTQFVMFPEIEVLPNSNFSARTDQAYPIVRFGTQLAS